jgi:hypothetical protein
MIESCERRIARGGWAEDLTRQSCQGMIGPRNTLSNLAYAVVGIWTAWRYQDSASAAFAVAMCLLATGSALYHAQKTLPANRMDWLGMMAVLGVLLAHGWAPHAPAIGWLMLAGGGLAGYTYLSQRQLYFDDAVAAYFVVSSIGPAWRGQWLVLGISWLVFAVAYGVWQLDKRRSRWVGVWGHAIWHVLTAVGFGLLFQAQR